MAKYIERERIEKFFDGIYDCADLVFEPNDHCCAADDCGHCKWYEAKNAIAKRILSIPAADVRPVARGKWEERKTFFHNSIVKCSLCGNFLDLAGVNAGRGDANFCPNCGADMREES